MTARLVYPQHSNLYSWGDSSNNSSLDHDAIVTSQSGNNTLIVTRVNVINTLHIQLPSVTLKPDLERRVRLVFK